MDLKKINLEDMMNVAVEVVRSAGYSVIQESKYHPIRAEYKEDGSVRTNLDVTSEEIILGHLTKAFPKFGYLSEEAGSHGSQEARWIIDPIDCSEEAMRRIPLWSINLAFEYMGNVVLGVIYDPNQQCLFTAIKGRGAHFNGNPIRVSAVNLLENAYLCHSGHKQLLESPFWSHFEFLLGKVGSENGIGNYLGWMLIAMGKADLGFHYWLGPEDIAPLAFIVEEAGGRVSGLDGQFSLESDPVLVSNGLLHDQALKIINSTNKT